MLLFVGKGVILGLGNFEVQREIYVDEWYVWWLNGWMVGWMDKQIGELKTGTICHTILETFEYQ